MIWHLKQILITAEAWVGRCLSWWVLAVSLALAVGLSGFPDSGALGGSAAACPAAASVAAGTLFHGACGGDGNQELLYVIGCGKEKSFQIL